MTDLTSLSTQSDDSVAKYAHIFGFLVSFILSFFCTKQEKFPYLFKLITKGGLVVVSSWSFPVRVFR